MRRLLPSCALLCAALSPVCAQTALPSTQVLRVHFSIATPPSPVPDVLQLGFGLVTVTAAHSTRTAMLWDGGTLLGTAVTSSFGSHVGALSLNPANSWRQTGSVWNFDSPGDVADFSSIQNATITGIIDFTVATGSMTINLNNVSLMAIRATSPNGGQVPNSQPIISEVVIGPKLVGPVPGTVNTINTWTSSGSPPGNLMAYAVGFSVAPILVPVAPPVFFDLAPPLVTLITLADPNGESTMQFFVPPFAAGITVFAQCVELVGPGVRVSNFVRHTF